MSTQPVWTQYLHISDVDNLLDHLRTSAETVDAGRRWVEATATYLASRVERDSGDSDLTVGATGVFYQQNKRIDIFEYRRIPRSVDIVSFLEAMPAEPGIEIAIEEISERQWRRSLYLLKRSPHTENGKTEIRFTRGDKPVRVEFFREANGYLFSSQRPSLLSALLPTVDHQSNVVFSFEASFDSVSHLQREQLLEIRESVPQTQSQRGDNESVSSWLSRLLMAAVDLRVAREMLSGNSQLSAMVNYAVDSEEFTGKVQFDHSEDIAAVAIQPLRGYRLSHEKTEGEFVKVWVGFRLAPALLKQIRDFNSEYFDELSDLQQLGLKWLEQQEDIEVQFRALGKENHPPAYQVKIRCEQAAGLMKLIQPLGLAGINSILRSEDVVYLAWESEGVAISEGERDVKLQRNETGRILTASFDVSRFPSLLRQLQLAGDSNSALQSVEDAILSAALTTKGSSSNLSISVSHTGRSLVARAKTDLFGATTLLNSWLPLFDRLRSRSPVKPVK